MGDAAPPADRERLHDELVEILAEDLPSPGAAEKAAASVLEERGDAVYVELIWILTSLRCPPDEAKQLWGEILHHKYLTSERLGRNIGVRIAALDYLTNIRGRIARPRVIDPAHLDALFRDATVDPLTGLENRRAFRERFAAETSRARRYRRPFALVLLDLDDFKRVNDTRGHAAGDEVLRKAAAAIRGQVRRDVDAVTRWGGEEFAVLLPETSKEGAAAVAERIRARIEKDLVETGTTVSGGISAAPADGDDEETLFSFADRALYRAKAEGKNRISLAPVERRAFPRLDERVPVRITPLEDGGAPLEATTTNIGGGGVAFRWSEPLAVTKRIRGEVGIDGRTAVFIGRVARVEEIARDRFEIGIQFLEIDPESRALILSLAS